MSSADESVADLLRPDWTGPAPLRVGNVWCFHPAATGDRPLQTTQDLARWIVRSQPALVAIMRRPGGDRAAFAHGGEAPEDCPVSGTELSRMLDTDQFGQVVNDLGQMRDNHMPPSATLDFLRSAFRPAATNVTLDIGCSAGKHLWVISSAWGGRLVGLDLDLLAMLAGDHVWRGAAGTPPHWVAGSATELPFAGASFSHVASAVTLSYVAIVPALREAARVLKPAGQLLITLEGPGYWRSLWDDARPWSVRRAQLLRWLLGNKLMGLGIDWQRNRLTRRLAGATQYPPTTLTRLVRRAGFDVDVCETLMHYRDLPRLVGISARKR